MSSCRATNANDKGAPIAVKIANHILKEAR